MSEEEESEQKCGNDMVYECAMNCVEQQLIDKILGDGFCDDGSQSDFNLNCATFNFDGGDCNGLNSTP